MNLIATPGRRIPMMLVMVVAFLSCDNDTTAPAGLADDSSINLATTSLGQTLTGVDGKTLYFFAGDADGKTGCTPLDA